MQLREGYGTLKLRNESCLHAPFQLREGYGTLNMRHTEWCTKSCLHAPFLCRGLPPQRCRLPVVSLATMMKHTISKLLKQHTCTMQQNAPSSTNLLGCFNCSSSETILIHILIHNYNLLPFLFSTADLPHNIFLSHVKYSFRSLLTT